jgi:hypothetical protein
MDFHYMGSKDFQYRGLMDFHYRGSMDFHYRGSMDFHSKGFKWTFTIGVLNYLRVSMGGTLLLKSTRKTT